MAFTHLETKLACLHSIRMSLNERPKDGYPRSEYLFSFPSFPLTFLSLAFCRPYRINRWGCTHHILASGRKGPEIKINQPRCGRAHGHWPSKVNTAVPCGSSVPVGS